MVGTTPLDHAVDLKTALDKAGENRNELELFIEAAKKSYGNFGHRAAKFLIEGMPEEDLKKLNFEFLKENLNFAMKARMEFSWCKNLPE